MKTEPNAEIERYRYAGDLGGPPNTNSGAFLVPFKGKMLTVVASNGLGWDHVSVSVKHRCPTWEEMCFIKDLFFRDDEVVMQLHPAKSDYVNNHPNCLHLWRPQTDDEIAAVRSTWGDEWAYGDLASPGPIPLPDSIMVGIKEAGVIT